MAKLKFSANQDGFTLPPEGTFDFEIIEVKLDQDRKGDPQVVTRLEIADGPHEGIRFRQYYTANESRGWVLVNLLKACGVDYEVTDGEDGEPPEFEFDPDDLLGCYMRAEIVLNRDEQKKKTYINLNNEQASKLSGADDGAEQEQEPEQDDTEVDEPPVEEAPKARRRRPRA